MSAWWIDPRAFRPIKIEDLLERLILKNFTPSNFIKYMTFFGLFLKFLDLKFLLALSLYTHVRTHVLEHVNRTECSLPTNIIIRTQITFMMVSITSLYIKNRFFIKKKFQKFWTLKENLKNFRKNNFEKINNFFGSFWGNVIFWGLQLNWTKINHSIPAIACRESQFPKFAVYENTKNHVEITRHKNFSFCSKISEILLDRWNSTNQRLSFWWSRETLIQVKYCTASFSWEAILLDERMKEFDWMRKKKMNQMKQSDDYQMIWEWTNQKIERK